MSTHATGTIETKTWGEQPYDESEGLPKLSRGSMTESFHGDIEGDARVEALLVYRDDGSASFVGLQRVIGRIGDRSGSFVLQASGTFGGGTGQCAWFVAPGSGTGDLRGLQGEGGYVWDGQTTRFTLDYDFE